MSSELMHARRLKEGDVIIRRDAAKVLGYLNSASGGRAIQPLIEALNDKDWRVKYNVIESLIRIGDNQAVEPLIKLGKDEIEFSRSVIYSLIDLADDHYMKMGEPETHDTWWDEWEKFEELILFKHHYLKLIEKLESYWKI